MRALVTTSRMPFAVTEIKKLGGAGHAVFASDTFDAAPGSHSKYVQEHYITASPRHETARFLDDVERIISREAIELLLPAFEEVFYIASQRARFNAITHVFASPLETLTLLHDKVRFMELCRDLGLPVPRTIVVRTDDGLAAATRELKTFFARPAYSRGGLKLYTNTGPLAGALSFEDCEPSEENPWLVQGYLRGKDYCSFSIVHDGRVAAHSTYVHPKTIEHAGGIVFDSVDTPETLALTQQIAEATKYHGQMSLDFMETEEGFVVIECNPRPTAGVTVMPDEMFVRAVVDGPRGPPAVAPAGTRRKIGLALVRDMLLHPSELPSDIATLASRGKDVYAEGGDVVPLLYTFLSYAHVAAYRRTLDPGRHERSSLMAAYFEDICWDGEPIE